MIDTDLQWAIGVSDRAMLLKTADDERDLRRVEQTYQIM